MRGRRGLREGGEGVREKRLRERGGSQGANL